MYSDEEPLQLRPPCLGVGLEHCLFLTYLRAPCPQVVEQDSYADQLPHNVQPPSTELCETKMNTNTILFYTEQL